MVEGYIYILTVKKIKKKIKKKLWRRRNEKGKKLIISSRLRGFFLFFYQGEGGVS